MNESKLLKVWYGQQQPNVMLRSLSWLFKRLSGTRRWLYQSKILRSHQVKVPVIIVGNITAGGGGKTPMVIWLVNHLKSKGLRPGIISRGHGGKRKVEPMFVTPQANPVATGDEPLLMAQSTQVPVMVGKDRVKAAKQLIAQYNVNVIISDDGMQHYALKRDAEIIMIDAQWQTGNNRFIPAGPLREPLDRMKAADLIVYKGQMNDHLHYVMTVESIYKLNNPSIQRELSGLRNQKIHAMAGIANPDSFFKLLSKLGLAVIKHPLPDHHQYNESDFNHVGEDLILMTEKDAVKCAQFTDKDIWVVKVSASPTAETVKCIDSLIDEVMS